MLERIVQHGFIAVRHLPASRGALADHLDYGAPVKSCLLSEMQRLGEPLHKARDGNLVAHLGHLPGTGLADAPAELCVGVHHGFGRVIGGLIAAAHDRELAVFRPRLSARNRCVHKTQPAVARLAIKLFGHLGRNRRVIDKDGALLHPREGPVGAEADAAQVVVIAHAGHHEIRAAGGVARGRGASPAML